MFFRNSKFNHYEKSFAFYFFNIDLFHRFSQDFGRITQYTQAGKEEKFPKNEIKVNFLGLLYGYAAIFYERDIKGRFVLETGAGITTKNLYRDKIQVLEFVEEIKKTYRNYDNRNQGYGVFFSIQPKILREINTKGRYLGIQLQHLMTPYSVEKTDAYGKFTGEFYKEKVNQTNLLLNFGFFKTVKFLTFDYGFGFGAYRSQEKRFHQGFFNKSGVYVADYETNFTRWGLLIDVQLKIGGIF